MGPDVSKDYFAVLGLSPHADPEVVKAAYRALAKKYHPDRQAGSGGSAREKFHELQEAYELLSDEQQRSHYLHLREHVEQCNKAAAARRAQPAMLLRLDDRWDHLVREFPDTARHHARFGLVSPRLARQFRLTILGTQNPASFERIAARMERGFYRRYFSYHSDLQGLARKLARRRRRHALRELSREIRGRRLLSRRYRRDLLYRYESRYLHGPGPGRDGRLPPQLSLPGSALARERERVRCVPRVRPAAGRFRLAAWIGTSIAFLTGAVVLVGVMLQPPLQQPGDLARAGLEGVITMVSEH
jgi:curved DNA-binding protein CbpA